MVIERDLPRRTTIQQVSNIYWKHQDTGSIRAALGQAFDVEAVTKRFFDEYKRVFDLAMDRVEGFGSNEEEQEDKKLFVQTLFNRLMFIYFLSRKGWLTFRGDNDYLNALWRDYGDADDEDKNFHVDRLLLVFFAGLNNPQSRDLNRNNPVLYAKIGAPPFLNGGLFEKTDLDKRTGVIVPDSVIEPILRELFDKFNFTVMESTPFDIEVAVDPEMLGKVFEELVTGRHDTGSYYTPRPVVSFMCREALKGYLEGCDTGLHAEEVAKFVDERDTSEVSLSFAPKVAEALEDVTVVDPACGSGAYLLGMMQELVDLRTALFNIGVDARSLYDLKLHIIQRNLYGVDIDEFAVNIAMLRMWLSLVIEYEGDTPEPLPNLDFKVVKGDSLLGPDPGQLNQSRYQIELSDLPRLKALYMPATADKDKLRREIVDARGTAAKRPGRCRRSRRCGRLANRVRRGVRQGWVRRSDSQSAVYPVAERRRQTGTDVQGRRICHLHKNRRHLPTLLRARMPAAHAWPRFAGLHHVQQLAQGRVRQTPATLLLGVAYTPAVAGTRQGYLRERHRRQ